MKEINIRDGIDHEEANTIAREFFHRRISACGKLGNPIEKESIFEYPVYLGKQSIPHNHPLAIEKASGKVSMEEFYPPITVIDLESKPTLREILNGCDTSGEGDILAWEFWLQQKMEVRIPCPSTDHFTLILEGDDYPPEVPSLALHQRYSYCKYGNGATIFAVVTIEKSAKKEACSEPQLADVRTKKAYELQSLPANEGKLDEETYYRFKLVSPNFAAEVYTTVYEVKRYEYWVDRSFEVLRYAESIATECICDTDQTP